jgi:arylsulfatase
MKIDVPIPQFSIWRNSLGKLLFIVILICCGRPVFSQNESANTDKRPNIIMIVADDLGFSDLGCYGGEINTPNLDKMAAAGMQFSQFYNSGVCTVSRATMLTGLYARHKGSYLKDNMVTIAEAFKSSGYSTIMSGKWHLGNAKPNRPIDRGFQDYYGPMAGSANYFDPTLGYASFYSNAKGQFYHNDDQITEVGEDFYITDALTDFSIQQIEKCVGENKPFFLHLAYNAPHFPLQALPEDIIKYKGVYDSGYQVLRKNRYKRMVELGLISPDWKLPDPDSKTGDFRYDLPVLPWDEVVNQMYETKKMEVYAAMVDRMDQNIGRILKVLKKAGIEDNTLIMFFSDNGGCASMPLEEEMSGYYQYHMGKEVGSKYTWDFCGPGWATVQSSPFRRYKVWTYEGGIATPMIVRWKGKIRPNSSTNQPSHIVDIFPTLLDITKIAYPEEYKGNEISDLEGESFSSVLFQEENKKLEQREIGWGLFGNRAYRKGKWKIVWGVNTEKWELYDMEKDRTETTDLSESYPEIVDDLRKQWKIWAQNCSLI